MTPAARAQAVVELLERTKDSRVPMDTTIGDYMRHRRYVGSKDRREIAERMYNIVRAHGRIGWWLAQVHSEDTPRRRLLSWLILGEAMDVEQVTQLFNGTKYGAEPLEEAEISYMDYLFRHKDEGGLIHADMPEAARVECPAEYEERLRALFGDDFAAQMDAMKDGATLDLRVNMRLSDREIVKASLAKDEVETSETKYSPWGLRAADKAYMSQTKAFKKGWVDIQDEGSQLIAYVCDAQPGMQVLDYCAGGGGKALALAGAMKNKGRLVVSDIDERRLSKAKPRFKRAHVLDNIEVRPLSDERHRKWLRRQKETFDVVLIDVPCSGSGTWRRNPDMRWRVFGPKLEEIKQTQAEILDKVAKAVKVGGRLVYATCSILAEENEDQIAAFLERNNEFEVLPLDKAWPEGTPPCEGDFMRLTPRDHGTDGFFAAVLVRKSA